MRINKRKVLLQATIAALAAISSGRSALAGTSTNSSGDPTQQGSDPAITISLSGQTALRNFTSSPGISTLQPGGSITLRFGSAGTNSITYYASNSPDGYVQLASKDFTLGDFGTGATSVANAPEVQRHSAFCIEWHEQGSIQGQFDLINDQIGYVSSDGGATGYLSNINSRGPSTANPTWINSTSFTTGTSLNGHSISSINFANTYDVNVYDRKTGKNTKGGQDRIQFSVGEFKTESLSKPGAASPFALPGQPGYGKGNPALSAAPNTIGLGFAGRRQQLFDESFADQSTDKIDPNSDPSDAYYAAGPWNSAGANNIDSKQITVTAVSYAANPGTGLKRLNKGDSQWLLATGRLQNGADFNVVNRANDAGQRVVPAINVGLDPSWSVGENDDGSTSGTPATNIQKTLGPGIRFSGKTSGTTARDTIAQSRLGFGPLSLAESREGSAAAPIRALDIDFEHLADANAASVNVNNYVRANFDNIVDFKFKAVLVSHYNTIKAANVPLLNGYRNQFQIDNGRAPTSTEEQTWWNGLSSEQTGIKGDPYGNVRAFINNVTNSVGSAAAGITPSSANNPADAVFGAGFLVPGLLNYSREYDGGPLTPNNLSPAQIAIQQNVKANYGTRFTADDTPGSNNQTVGTNSFYGSLNSSTVILNGLTVSSAINGGTTTLAIRAKNNSGTLLASKVEGPKGNYLFGNFNQNGTRDYASAKEAVNAALSLHAVDGAANSIYTAAGGVSNATVVPSLSGSPGWATTANTKGDLIILGDLNSDGAFDGKDIYGLAKGISLSDNAGTTELGAASGTDFADRIRNPNAHLNKNAALDHAHNATANAGDANQVWLRQSARVVLTAAALPGGATSISLNTDGSVNYTWDPTGANAFKKTDVNHDGRINRADAQIVDHYIGNNFKNLNDQLNAVISIEDGTLLDGFDINGKPATETSRSISLVDPELNDDININIADFLIIKAEVGAGLKPGDANFDGNVDIRDLYSLATHWQSSVDRWSLGDFNLDGTVNAVDLGLLGANWQASGPSLASAFSSLGLPLSAVPEPGSLGLIALAGGAVMRRRRRM